MNDNKVNKQAGVTEDCAVSNSVDSDSCSKTSCSETLGLKDEITLASYVDGECSWLRSFFIRKVLRRNSLARQYVDHLERSGGQFKRVYLSASEHSSRNFSISEKVAQRIAQEERLALLRSIPMDTERKPALFGNFAWGAVGAAMASLVFFVIFPVYSPESASRAVNSFNQAEYMLEPVSALQNPAASGVSMKSTNTANAGNSVQYIGADLDRLGGVAGGATQFGLKEKGYYVSERELRALQLAAAQTQRLLSATGLNNDFSGEAAYHADNNWQQQSDSLAEDQPDYNQAQMLNKNYLNARRKRMASQVADVDWVRSHGRVKVLKHPEANSTILWVNRSESIGNGREPRNTAVTPVFVADRE